MATSTEVQTLKVVLDDANPQKIADALQQIKLGTMFTVQSEQFTSAGGVASVTLAFTPLSFQQIWVEDATSALDEGAYVVTTEGNHSVPTGGSKTGVGVVIWDGDKTLTWTAKQIKDVTIKYLAAPQRSLTDDFAQG